MAACFITLLGVARGLAPDVILLRAACGGAATGLIVAVAVVVARLLRGTANP